MDASALAVFAEGLLGFFSPCVLPVVPLYAAYLSGSGAGNASRWRLLANTLLFVAGIASAFFLLGLAATSVGRLFSAWQDALVRAGGVIIALLGLFQLGAFGAGGVLSRERRLPARFNTVAMNPLTAFAMGFFFSFAWTPCVGPALASVLVMAGSSSTQVAGLALVGVYTLGFGLPFVAVGVFAKNALDFLRAHASMARVTALVGGALLVVVGVSMVMGWTQIATRYLAGLGGDTSAQQVEDDGAGGGAGGGAQDDGAGAQGDSTTDQEAIEAPDFVLEDQTGYPHYLSNYRGKVVFLNFWTTWCTYCKLEMPDIQQLYEETGKNEGDVVVLGVANPAYGPERGISADVELDEVVAFLDEGGYTYPTLMDLTGNVFRDYGVAAYPTTFVIDANGNIVSYYPGAMSREVMDSLIADAMNA